jgi:hypothetical protein
MDFEGVDWVGIEWTDLAEVRDRKRVACNAGNFLNT